MQITIDLKVAVQACGAGILIAIAIASFPVAAQRPSSAQASAIREACRADYGANCAGVPTGGSAALACLQRNAAKTSPACQQALQAVAGSANAAAPASSAAAGTASNAPSRDVAATPVPSAAQPPGDTWPHTVTGPNATATVYQPQVISWPGFNTLNARMVLGILPAGAQAPTLGSIDVAFTTETHLEQRMVTLTEPRLVALISYAVPSACRPDAIAGVRLAGATLMFSWLADEDGRSTLTCWSADVVPLEGAARGVAVAVELMLDPAPITR